MATEAKFYDKISELMHEMSGVTEEEGISFLYSIAVIGDKGTHISSGGSNIDTFQICETYLKMGTSINEGLTK